MADVSCPSDHLPFHSISIERRDCTKDENSYSRKIWWIMDITTFVVHTRVSFRTGASLKNIRLCLSLSLCVPPACVSKHYFGTIVAVALSGAEISPSLQSKNRWVGEGSPLDQNLSLQLLSNVFDESYSPEKAMSLLDQETLFSRILDKLNSWRVVEKTVSSEQKLSKWSQTRVWMIEFPLPAFPSRNRRSFPLPRESSDSVAEAGFRFDELTQQKMH